MKMDGTKVLITGGGRGIGARTAEVLAERGCQIALCDRMERELKETASRIAAQYDASVIFRVCDVSDPESVYRMVTEAVDWAGGLDVLVNNAGVIGPMDPVEDTAPEDWRRALDINLFGTVYCTRAVLPWMKKQGHGKIINFSGSGVGQKTIEARRSSYVTSKFAVYGFTVALAQDLAADNIQVNIVSPGPVETALWDGVVSNERRRAIRKTGQDLSGTPVARLIAFLASARSGNLTGKILSAHWDDVDDLARNIEAMNDSCRNTLRKIDDKIYFSADGSGAATLRSR
jgi:NAD(P)-dependent dehydrogenase (short-subunit alcohol dehydrogenase family)